MNQNAREAAVTEHLIHAAFEAFTRRNVEAFTKLTHPRVELLVPTAMVAHGGKPYVGHSEIQRYFDDVASVWQELRLVPQRYADRADMIVILGRVYARDAVGVTDLPAAWVIRIEERLIAWLRVFNDRHQALATAGFEEVELRPL